MRILVLSNKQYFFFIFILFGCNSAENNAKQEGARITVNPALQDSLIWGKALFDVYCNNCHMLPDPARLPVKVWEKGVLPLMAIRMGLQNLDYVRQISPEEKRIEDQHNLIPATPLLKESDFNLIKNYILNVAPPDLPFETKRLKRNASLTQFDRKNIPLENSVSYITGIRYNEESGVMWISNLYNEVIEWKWGKGILRREQVSSPVVYFTFWNSKTYFTQIGSMLPSELSVGGLTESGNNSNPVLTNLHRPVSTLIEDLNGDDIPEIIVGNFGKNIGSLSFYSKNKPSDTYEEVQLLSSPGAARIFLNDMNGDGKKDIIALFAQADESIYIFYQQDSLKFIPDRILRFPPDYGTTDMVCTDYNNDGWIDIVTANGDNADYSMVLKKYHGIRVHINQGNNIFKEAFFYPVYGATKVLAEDFDKDGDIDLAINCFYSDYGPLNSESFVYLRNDDALNFKFSSFNDTTELPVNSLNMEKADIDADGDMDIILGNFAASPIRVPSYLEQQWKKAKYGLVVFENRLR